MWKQTIFDCIPFACLMTGSHVKTPMVTRIVEQLILTAVGALFALFIGFHVLESKFEDHIKAMEKVDARLTVIENCLMVRSCTK